MQTDYYKILGIPRNSSDVQIKQAYRKAASQWHPQRNHGVDSEIAAKNFASSAEAFQVLSNPALRGYYDRYGETKFKNGVPGTGPEAFAGWKFDATPMSVFEHFFGSNNPLGDYVPPDDLFLPAPPLKQAPTIEVNVYCSLEELFLGATKKVKIIRSIHQNGVAVQDEKILTCEIQAGWREGTKLTFPNEGNEGEKCTAGDVVFTLKELPHPRLHRIKNDLHFRSTISLKQALTGFLIDVMVLDGRTLPLSINEVVKPGYKKTVLHFLNRKSYVIYFNFLRSKAKECPILRTLENAAI